MVRKVTNNPRFLQIVFVISLFSILFVAGMAYKNYVSLSRSTRLVVHTYEVNRGLETILANMKDAQMGQRGYIITGDSTFLRPYFNARENINASISRVKMLTKNNKEQQKNLRELTVLIDNQFELLTSVTQMDGIDDNKRSDFKLIFLETKNQMDKIRLKVNRMVRIEDELLSNRKLENRDSLNLTPFIIYALIVMTLLLMYLAYAKMRSDIKKLSANNTALEIFKESINQAEIINHHGTWTWNIDTNEFTYSDNLYRILGEKPKSFPATAESYIDFVHPDDKDYVIAATQKMREEKDLSFIYYRIIQKNGTIRHFKAYGRSHLGIDGVNRLLGVTTDVTDETESYRNLEDRAHLLEMNNKELSAFNYVASHDLQEPLRKIQTFLSRLEEKEAGNISQSGITYIERIQSAAGRMRLLIDDLLQYSRTNRKEKSYEESNINLLLEAARQDLAELINQNEAIIEADTLPIMEVIPFQIQQLFTNLINNAIKYRSIERQPLIKINYEKVDITTEIAGVELRDHYFHKLTIADNGIGFDQEYAEKIFQLFSRLHNRDEYTGTGIGLSIVKKIVENHKGFIRAFGKSKEGATFIIYLPLEPN